MSQGRGRPLTFETPEDLLASWEEYKRRKREKQDLICKENFCCETGNYVDLFANYKKKPEFCGAIEQIEKDCKYYVSNKAIKGEYNAAISKLLLSHNYGVREKQDVNVQGGITINIPKEDENL